MNEIESLVERARRYLRSAEILLEDGDYDSSVSRTYYAMFYSAQAMLLTKRLSFSSHRAVISAFGEHFVKTGVLPREMGRELNRTFTKRQLGDYEYRSVITRDEAEQVLERGNEFVERIVQHLSEAKML
jgi:uncharacterized protein (UPF0332 family)